MIAAFLNQILVEVGNHHNWTQDYVEQEWTLTEDTQSVDVTTLSTAYATPVLDEHKMPLVAGGYGKIIRLRKYEEKGVMENERTDWANSGVDYDEPDSFTVYPTADNWRIDFRPWIAATVEAPYSLKAAFYNPQPELATDGSDDETNVRYHSNALMLGTLWLALNERGEEIGEPGNMAEQQYQRALGDAVYTDQKVQAGLGNQMEAWRD